MAKRPKLEIGEGEEVHVTLTHATTCVREERISGNTICIVWRRRTAMSACSSLPKRHIRSSRTESYRGDRSSSLRKVKGKLEIALTGNGQEHKEEQGSGDGYRELMELSLRDAIEATRAVNSVQWDVDSIRSIALSLFIQRVKVN